MSFGALDIAKTALSSQQKSLDVIAHNIANVNTPGYSKQTPNSAAATPELIGGHVFGRGVNFTGVGRSFDQFIFQSETRNNSSAGYWGTLNTALKVIDPIFGAIDASGLSNSVDSFFASIQKLANSPTDSTSKNLVIGDASKIITVLGNMGQSLEATLAESKNNVSVEASTTNTILEKIRTINSEIAKVESISGVANDLRDQRDQEVRNLSLKMGIQNVKTNGSGYLLQTKTGDLLIQDNVIRTLNVKNDSTGIPRVFLGNSQLTSSSGDGSIAGQIEAVIKIKNLVGKIDDFTKNFIQAINIEYANGTSKTPKGTYTSDYGSTPALALSNVSNASPYSSSIKTGSFYVHHYDSSGTAIIPLGGTRINITAATTSMNDIVTALGVSGLTATLDITGKLSISAPVGESLAFSNDTSNFLASYGINTLFSGSSFSDISLNASSSNLNTATASLVDSSILNSGDTFKGIYGVTNKKFTYTSSPSETIVSRISGLITGYTTDVNIAQSQSDFFTFKAQAITKQRQNVSSVNIDAELVDMIKYQQAYAAASKIIQVNNDMMGTLMSILR